MFYGNIKHDATIAKIILSWVSFAPHSVVHRLFPQPERHEFQIEQQLFGLELPRKSRCHGTEAFRSLTQSSQTRVLHVVDLFMFCFIPRLNFLVSYDSDPSPRIFSICKQVGWKILGTKIEIVNCLLVVCTRKLRFQKFVPTGLKCGKRKRNCTSHQGVPRNRPVALESARTRLVTGQRSRLNFPFIFSLFCCCCWLFCHTSCDLVRWVTKKKKTYFQEPWNFWVIVREEAQCWSAKIAGLGHSIDCSRRSDSEERAIEKRGMRVANIKKERGGGGEGNSGN